MNYRLALLLVLALSLAACQKNLFEYGGSGKPKDQPKYSVAPNLNGKTVPVQNDPHGK